VDRRFSAAGRRRGFGMSEGNITRRVFWCKTIASARS